jgi:hypothetical protein
MMGIVGQWRHVVKIDRTSRGGIVGVAILLALACGDDEPTHATGAYQLVVNPAVVTVARRGRGP